MAKLKRSLGLFGTTIAGIGIILGAGIYALIGVAAGETGNSVWLGFLVAAIVAGFTGLSYAELSSIFKSNAGEYDYIHSAFGKKVALLVSLLIIFTGVVSAAAVALGFAGYFSTIFSFDIVIIAMVMIVFMSLVNFFGIKESSWFNIFSTSVELIGLILIIFLGIGHYGNVDIFAMPNGFTGVLKAGALLFFAFMGFETIVKLAEETKNPSKTIPKAIIISVIITAIIYVLVSIASVSIISSSELAQSSSPLADVVKFSMGNEAAFILVIIALFATSNSVLITMVTTSRLMYGIAREKALPRLLCKVHSTRKTPYYSVFIVGVLTILFSLIGDIKLVADITTAFLFVTFALVNLSLIVIRYNGKYKRDFKIPLNIGRFPVLALLGVISSLIMLVFSLINIFG